MTDSSQQRTEIASGRINAVTYTANGEYLVSGGKEDVRVWRVKDGEGVATMPTEGIVFSVAASKDGRYIAAGSSNGKAFIWDTTAGYEQVFAERMSLVWPVSDVDFSPDSTRLVSANSSSVTIWNIAERKRIRTLNDGSVRAAKYSPHGGRTAQYSPQGVVNSVQAAKYSPQGNRIATATEECIQVWGGDDGRLLVKINTAVCPWQGLLWFNDHLFVTTKDSKIKEFDASTGSTVSDWSVPSSHDSCIALPQHGKFVAYSTGNDITFWDTSTHSRLSLISRSSERCSIAFSPNDRVLAIVAEERNIVTKDLSLINEPDILIESAALNAWKHDQLSDAEALLTAAIPVSTATAHHVLASRAFVRVRLRQWDTALVDAEESIKIQSSVLGWIAKYAAIIGKGDTLKGRRMCDIAFHLHPDHAAILLLFKAIVLFVSGEHEDAISRLGNLITVGPLDLTFYAVQAHMHLVLGDLRMERGDYDRAVQSFKRAQAKLGNCTRPPPLLVSLITGWKFDNIRMTIQQRLCEALLSAGCIKEAAESVLCMVEQKLDKLSLSMKTWVSEFIQRCLSTPNGNGSVNLATVGDNNRPQRMTQLLREWIGSRLMFGSWEEALTAAAGFTVPRSIIYQVICDYLEMSDRVADAIACFHQMCSELPQELQTDWSWDFKSRCRGRLENLGDSAMDGRRYDDAILQYTSAILLDSATSQSPLVKRSKALARTGAWEDALNDADKAIELDPSSPLCYERRFAALYGIGRHADATQAFETMLSKMSQSSDPETREQSRRYVRPEKTRETIRTTVGDTIRDSPLVLINTISGRLCNKLEQASAFETTPIFTELISSMTTYIDNVRIQQEVGEYFRYSTLSHKWEDDEPLFEKVIRIVVYDLEGSPAHEKLQMFCKIVRDAGFNWAWSDTCCINKGDHFVLQEALVSMFKWYQRSAMTLIFLRGVDSRALRGALTRSIWNTRAWTLQEYHASKVVRIYTEDWTPYLGLTVYNHKDSPDIISEMEDATGISAQALMALRPGLDDVREKLRLASPRQTTRIEDAAYSLLGLFSVSLPITYGEGDRALGRLLAQVLASSGDTSILAWTGMSGTFNSCLPSSITVFGELPTSHIPPATADTEPQMGAALRSPNLASVTRLYDRVNELPVPSFSGRRMRLPCLTFKLGQVSGSWDGSEHVFRARTSALGVVEIRTKEDLSELGSLYLVHPWIDFLLDRQPLGCAPESATEENADDKSSTLGEWPSFPRVSNTASTTRAARLMSRIGLPFGGRAASDTVSLMPPSTVSPVETRLRVLRFLARLRRPFGALLLTPTRLNVDEYRRVAAGSLITVQVEEITPSVVDKLIQGVRVLDVL